MRLNQAITILFLSFALHSFAQQEYWVFFTDKDGVQFDPYTYFDAKAIERRVVHNYPLDHYTDRPVRTDYLATVEQLADSTTYVTRWFNGVGVFATPEQLDALEHLPFVRTVQPMVWESQLAETTTVLGDSENEQLLAKQTKILGAKDFAEADFDGKGVRVAVFDAGFPAVDTHAAFEHIRKRNGIIKTFDFCKKKEKVYAFAEHGTTVLSCIAGMWKGQRIGLATGAEFLLARTEWSKKEPFKEEKNWLAAAEWADKNGAHIINSSLGYTSDRYFQRQLDGQSIFVSRAANMAASKGILVVNAAGNDGNGDWKKLGAPADADSVLTVGGIDPYTHMKISFTSYGPTADFRKKPNVAAFGMVYAASRNGEMGIHHGTSFASPLTAGFAACAMQARMGIKNMQLFKEIERSCSLFPYYDYVHGHGIPKADYFTGRPDELPPATFTIDDGQFEVKVMVKKEYLKSKGLEFESILDAVSEYSTPEEYLYYHIENKKGYLDYYYVLLVEQADVLTLPKGEFEPGETVRIHYRGYTETYTF